MGLEDLAAGTIGWPHFHFPLAPVLKCRTTIAAATSPAGRQRSEATPPAATTTTTSTATATTGIQYFFRDSFHLQT